jgi:hypothetical protein
MQMKIKRGKDRKKRKQKTCLYSVILGPKSTVFTYLSIFLAVFSSHSIFSLSLVLYFIG